jgi:nucleoside-diphosphate-sugar epimerase
MANERILLVGGTGALGARIARRLAAHGLPFRGLVRPETDPGSLAELAAEIVRGDLRDRSSLDSAMASIQTVITTAHSLDRVMAGHSDVSIAAVDRDGNRNLVAAAEAEGVARFVFVSFSAAILASHTPFTEAKAATEELLRRSRMRTVIVRPEAYQEQWFGPERRFEWRSGEVVIFGRGDAPAAYVSMDDVAEAVVRLAAMPDPPAVVELAGPEAIARNEAADVFEAALGRPLRRRHMPRVVLRLAPGLLCHWRPGLASVIGMGLQADLRQAVVSDRPLRELGIEPRGVRAYISHVVDEYRRLPSIDRQVHS